MCVQCYFFNLTRFEVVVNQLLMFNPLSNVNSSVNRLNNVKSEQTLNNIESLFLLVLRFNFERKS